jgi:hypothetical protein
MFGKIGYTWNVMRASWDILKQDKKLIVLPLISGLCCLIVLLSFALPLFLSGHAAPPAGHAAPAQQVAYYAVLFLFYFCNYFVITFFNAAIVFCAFARMEGRNPTIGDGIREAASRIHLIIGWALLAATVGLVLRIIEERSSKVGAIVAGLLGMAFSVVSFLVVPVLVVERKGPFAALKVSTKLLKQTWGEQLAGNFSFGLIFFLLGLPAFILLAIGIALIVSGSAIVLPGALIGIAVLYLIALSLVQSTLQVIYQTAIYLYARAPEIPHNYPTTHHASPKTAQ